MSVPRAGVHEAFRSIDVPDDEALRAAVALSSAMSKVDDETQNGFFKRDADIEAIRGDVGAIKLDIAGPKGERSLHRWTLGVILAMNVAILAKLFGH